MRPAAIVPGAVFYDVRKYRMGNTTMRSVGCWDVVVESVDPGARTAMARWNGNPAERWSFQRLGKLRTKRPVLIPTGFGGHRLARRGEATAAASRKEGE